VVKCYFDHMYGGDDYQPLKMRPSIASALPDWARLGAVPVAAAKENSRPRGSVSMPKDAQGERRASVSARGSVSQSNANQVRRSMSIKDSAGGPLQERGQVTERLRHENESLKEEITDLKITVDGLESERDYYFRKLREIEILCQTLEGGSGQDFTAPQLLQDVQTILYRKEDGEDELPSNENGPETERN